MFGGKEKDGRESSDSVFALCGIGGRGCVSGTIFYVYLILLQYST